MSSQYIGDPASVTLPTPLAIVSSTNATPIVMHTGVHGLVTGDWVFVDDHLVNTAANGAWEIAKINATTFQLVGSVGNGVGGATGTVTGQGFGASYAIPSDGDAPDAASVNVAFEAIGDRTAKLMQMIRWGIQIAPGGSITVDAGATAELDGAVTFGASSTPTFLDEIVLGASVATPTFSTARSFSRKAPLSFTDGYVDPAKFWELLTTNLGYLSHSDAPTTTPQVAGADLNPYMPDGASIVLAGIQYKNPAGHGAFPGGAPGSQPIVYLVQIDLSSAPPVVHVLASVQQADVSAATYQTATTMNAAPAVTGTTTAITLVSSGTPIQITAPAHGQTSGNVVTIQDTDPTSLANGTWVVTVLGVNTFTLDSSVGGVAAGPGGSVVGAAIVDLTRYLYRVQISTETGVNALTGTRVTGAQVAFTAPGMNDF